MSPYSETSGDSQAESADRKNGSDWRTVLKIWVGILGGLALQVAGLWSKTEGIPGLSTNWWVIVLFGSIIFLWGCCILASSKGYSRAWGLLGLTSCFGLILLSLFPRLERIDPESTEYKLTILQRNTILGITLGLGGVLFPCSLLEGRDSLSDPGFFIFLLLLYLVSIWGSYSLVRRKGRHWAWALASILTVPGWFLLFILPDGHKKEYPDLNHSLKEFQRGLVVLVVIGLILIAIAVPMYVSQKRAQMDHAASKDAEELGKVVKRVSHECSDRNFEAKPLPPDFLECLIGPYYGWQGTNRKSGVLVRIEDDVICACSPKGSRPYMDEQRYIYRVDLRTGEQLQAIAGPCTGKSYGGPDATCYEESIFESDGRLRKPRGRPCKEIKQ